MTTIRIRGRITIRSRGYLTDADTRRAWEGLRGGIAPNIPIDLHVTGPITGIGPWALHPIGDLLADASEVTITTDHGPSAALAAALVRAAEAAIGAETEFRSTHAIRAGGGA